MNIIQNQLTTAKWQLQLKRMSKVSRILDYYNNNYDSYISSKLKALYPNNYKSLSQFVRKYPLTNRLVDDISILFKNKPLISYDDNLLLLYINNSNLYSILPIINRLSNLTYKLGLLPRIYNDKLIIDVLLPDRCWVLQVPGFPTEISALYYLNDSSTDSITGYQVNLATKVTNLLILTVLISYNGNYKVINSLQNPYGYIPVVWILTEAVYDSFWPIKSNPLPLLNEYYVISKTYLAFAIAYQAIATMVTKGLDPKAVVPFGPSTWIDLPQNMGQGLSDAKYITPGTDFDSMRKFSLNILLLSSALMGLSALSYKKAQSFASGYALLLSKTDVMDYNSMQILMYTNRLSLLIHMISDTILIYTDFNVSPLHTILIKLPLTKVSYSEKLSTWKQLLDLGLITMYDIFKLKYPNISLLLLNQKVNTIPILTETIL